MIKSLKILLAPLVLLYGLIISLRNLFFDKSVFKSEKVNANVISVGNINVGGSGKTPLVIYVTNLLKNTGYKVGVLSRGYGRKSSGYKLVSKGEEILTSVEECGDEIYHTALAVSYTHLRAHETVLDLVCRLLLEKKTKKKFYDVSYACTQYISTVRITAEKD